MNFPTVPDALKSFLIMAQERGVQYKFADYPIHGEGSYSSEIPKLTRKYRTKY